MVFDGLCRKKEYTVKLQTADKNKEYNIAGKPGYVYNFFEDAEISVEGMKYVVIGTQGEMWAVPARIAEQYEIINKLDEDTFLAKTKPGDTIYEYKFIPYYERMEIKLFNGSVLNVNSDKSEHGAGDRLIRIKGEDEFWVVNGLVFDNTYEII